MRFQWSFENGKKNHDSQNKYPSFTIIPIMQSVRLSLTKTFNGFSDSENVKIIDICSNIQHDIKDRFLNADTLIFSHSNVSQKTILKILECIDVEKIEKLYFLSPQTKSTFTILQKTFLMQNSCNLNFLEFRFPQKNWFNSHMIKFMDFCVPLSKNINYLLMEATDCFYGDAKYQISSFLSNFKNLKMLHVTIIQAHSSTHLITKKIEARTTQFKNTNNHVLKSMQNNIGLESIGLFIPSTYGSRIHKTTQTLSMDKILNVLENNKSTFKVLTIHSNDKKERTTGSYFDGDISLLFEKLKKLPKFKDFCGKQTFQDEFKNFKYKSSLQSIYRLKGLVEKNESLKQITQTLKETNINWFDCFQMQSMFNLLNKINATHLMVEAMNNFSLINPKEIQEDGKLFEYMLVYNQDKELTKRFVDCIGQKFIRSYMEVFLDRMKINSERHCLNSYFSFNNENNTIQTLFEVGKNIDLRHRDGSTFQQYLYFYFPNAHDQILKNKQQIKCKMMEYQRDGERSSKRIKISHSDTKSFDVVDPIADDCLMEIFSFVENVKKVEYFQEWKCLQLTCKGWRNVYCEMLERSESLLKKD